MGPRRSDDTRGARALIAPPVLFGLLVAFNVFRTLHHAMWADELQAFLIASGSATLGELFHHLHYEGHPGLWHALLWAITRVSADPFWMQVAQAAIAAAVWILLYRAAPFTPAEKLLLLLGYFLFWEYFVLSRSYALMALTGFGCVAVRTWRPRSLMPWILLGLLANTVVYGTIWSMAMAACLGVEQLWTSRRAALAGAAVYAASLALAIATMAPVPDRVFHESGFGFHGDQLWAVFATPLDAFAPLPLTWLKEMGSVLVDPRTAAFPRFMNPLPTQGLAAILGMGPAHPLRVAAIVAASLAACWRIVGERRAALELTLGYAGVLLFTLLWNFPTYARHRGVVLLMLVAAVWTARARDPAAARRSWLWSAVLLANVAAGLTTLGSELRPYSAGRATAAWLTESRLADAFLLGSRDHPVLTVAGYLRRPIYYLESEAPGTFVVWNARRRWQLPEDELGLRIERALERAGRADAVVILNHELGPATEAATAARLSFAPLGAFTDSVLRAERFFVYRVAMRASG